MPKNSFALTFSLGYMHGFLPWIFFWVDCHTRSCLRMGDCERSKLHVFLFQTFHNRSWKIREEARLPSKLHFACRRITSSLSQDLLQNKHRLNIVWYLLKLCFHRKICRNAQVSTVHSRSTKAMAIHFSVEDMQLAWVSSSRNWVSICLYPCWLPYSSI